MDSHSQLIEMLESSPIYQEFEQAYTEATGLPVALRPFDTWQLPLHGKRKENSFCALMAAKSSSCASCLNMQEVLRQNAAHEPATVTCRYGLCETAVPVRLGRTTIGFLQSGQVILHRPTLPRLKHVAQQLAAAGVDVEAGEVAYLHTPVVSQKRLDSTTRFLAIFADHLSIRSNQIAIAQANTEPPGITRSKEFIQEHHTEPLSLAHVAAAVHMSTYYFCKLFKKTTGLNFTDFVSRTRTEKAKNLLLNRNLRVSEIAYDVGFQSLTHFNRIFKKIVGESPTEYRSHLPTMP